MWQCREGCPATCSGNTAARAMTRAEGSQEQVTEKQPPSCCEERGLRLQC